MIAVSGGAKKNCFRRISAGRLEAAINGRTASVATREDKAYIPLVDEDPEGITAQVIAPIICEGDAIGSVVILSREPRAKFGDMEMKLAATAAGFLGRQMES